MRHRHSNVCREGILTHAPFLPQNECDMTRSHGTFYNVFDYLNQKKTKYLIIIYFLDRVRFETGLCVSFLQQFYNNYLFLSEPNNKSDI
ncbi:hypothetical protein BpHYR1_042889 [Brachionus plicatilis]|uniref:Uncharacterized protein n=1 Tax=Brachionus plicatilis TaxID=10195 RepID=A0A3M7RK35_BRAPC|nr:hypothetical protein BpHYR1_042889 [Brachionus plicatilis]